MNNGGAGLGNNERTKLLPGWIRFFSWIFLFNPLLPIYLLMLRYGGTIGFSVFGYRYDGSIYHPVPIFEVAFDAFAAFTSFCLLRGLKNGIRYGLLCGYAGLTASVFNLINNSIHFWVKKETVTAPETFSIDSLTEIKIDGTVIPAHLFLLIPFIIVLSRRRHAWESINEATPSAPSAPPSFISKS